MATYTAFAWGDSQELSRFCRRIRPSLVIVQVLGEVKLDFLFNDGAKGTGTAGDMALKERSTLVQEGIVVVAIDVGRTLPSGALSGSISPQAAMDVARLSGHFRVTSRGMWTHNGRLQKMIEADCGEACGRMPPDARHAPMSQRMLSM